MFNELVIHAAGICGRIAYFRVFLRHCGDGFLSYQKRRSHAPLRGDAFPAYPLSRPTRIRSESNGFPSHQAGSAQRHP